MHKAKFFFVIVVAGLVVFQLGCKKDDTTGPGATKIRSISSLQAYSKSLTEVGLSWSASPDAAYGSGHSVAVKLGSATVTTITVPIGQSSTVVTGLTEGLIYTFSIVVTASSSDYTDSDPASIQWSPARRITTDLTLPEIKVYETASSSFPSGLIFFVSSSNSSKTVSIANPGADSLLIDAYARTESGSSSLTLRSAHLFRATWRITRFSSVSRNAASLDDPQAAPPDSTTYSSSNTSITIGSSAVTSSQVYYFKGNDGNYGRILVRQNPSDNTLIWGSSPDRYLNVQISYQTVPYNPYARPTKDGRRVER